MTTLPPLSSWAREKSDLLRELYEAAQDLCVDCDGSGLSDECGPLGQYRKCSSCDGTGISADHRSS